jgi:FkbM family methyltransferase
MKNIGTTTANNNEEQVDWRAEKWILQVVSSYFRLFPDHRGKGRLLRWMAKLSCAGKGGMVQTRFGARLCVDPQEYIGWQLITNGSFEPQSLWRAIQIMRASSGGVFLDVGANQGLFTCAVSQATSCSVVAVEANPAAFTRLCENVRLNERIHAVLVSCCAASESGVTEYFVPGDGQSAWAGVKPLFSQFELVEKHATRLLLAAEPLEKILVKAGVDAVELLKIDVEGFELDVFSGLDWDGPFRPRAILMECFPEEEEKRNWLKNRGYSAHTVRMEPYTDGCNYPEGNLLYIDTVLRKG